MYWMKILKLNGAVFILSLFFFTAAAQKSSFKVQIDEHTMVRDSFGTRIPYNALIKMLSTGSYTLDPVRDKSGRITEYELRNATAADKGKRETIAKIPGAENLPGPKVGAMMPYFETYLMDSTVISSDDLKGKVVVMNFWFTLCKPCIYEMPDLDSLVEIYKGRKDIVFLAPNYEKLSKVKAFIAKQPISYKVCPEAVSLIDKFGVGVYPTHLVISRTGKILNSYVGGLPGIENILKRDIDNALKQ